MKTRRVGTISMAIVLILFGVLIFIGQISRVSAVELGIKFWPGLLILLGGEILYFSIRGSREKEDIVIRYDIFSVFIVMVILATNIFMYGLLETGILDYVKLRVANETIRYEDQYR